MGKIFNIFLMDTGLIELQARSCKMGVVEKEISLMSKFVYYKNEN